MAISTTDSRKIIASGPEVLPEPVGGRQSAELVSAHLVEWTRGKTVTGYSVMTKYRHPRNGASQFHSRDDFDTTHKTTAMRMWADRCLLHIQAAEHHDPHE